MDHSYNGKYTSLRTMGYRFDSCMVYSAAYAAETKKLYTDERNRHFSHPPFQIYKTITYFIWLCSIKANYTGLSLRRSGFEPLHGRFTFGMWCKMSCTSRNEGYGSVHARSKSMRRSSNLTFPNRGILSIGKTSQSICPVLARMTDTLTSVLLEHKV